MFDGLFKTSSPAPAPASSGRFSGIFNTIPQPTTPTVSNPSPNPNATPLIPASATKGTIGGGYGASNIKDPSSGKPELTYENVPAMSSQLLSDRTAPDLDPTVPQKINSSILQNGRMPESVSQKIKAAFPGSAADELDHIMPLELGGSNERSNLRLEPSANGGNYNPSSNPTATDPLENALANDVQAGRISLVDAWKKMAAAKGVTLPEEGGPIPSTQNIQPNTEPDEQPKPGFFQGLFNGAKNIIGKAGAFLNSANNTSKSLQDDFVNSLQGAGQSFHDDVLSYLAGVPISTKDQSGAFKVNMSDAQIKAATTGINAPVTPNAPADPVSSALSLPKTIAQGATRAALGVGESTLGTGPEQPGEIPASKLSPTEQLATFGNQPVQPTASPEDIASARKGDPGALGRLGVAALGVGAATTIDPGMWGDDVLTNLAKETDPEKIVTALTAQGIDEDAARTIAPIISKASTPEQVKAVLTVASQHGIIFGAKEEATGAAEDFAKQEAAQSSADKFQTTKFEQSAKADPENLVQSDEQAVKDAEVKTLSGTGTGINSLDKDTRGLYENWVNARSTSNKAISGKMVAQQFESLRGQGMDAVHAFQSGDRTGPLADLQKANDDLLSKEQAAGIDVGKRDNYLYQQWANTPEEIDKAWARYVGENPGRAVNLNPGFTKEATFPDYKTGEALGLTPKYNNVPDIMNARVRASEQALADRKFVDQLMKRNLIQPGSKVGKGWTTLDPDRFPGAPFTKSVKAPTRLAELINGYLKPPEGAGAKLLQTTARAATTLKSIVLTSGIAPGTAINMHGFNELAATVPEVFNQPSLFGNALKYMFYPKSAGNFITENLSLAKEAALSGVQLGGEEMEINSLKEQLAPKGVLGKIGGTLSKGREILYNSFAKPLFEEMIPALKMQMYAANKESFIEKGMSEADSAKAAADRANKTFGGLNLASMGRDKNLQNLLKTFTLAPDYWEARMGYTGSAIKGLFTKGAVASKYRAAALTIAGAYIAMNIANKEKTGHWMFENDPGHSMDVLLGQDSKGKDIYFRPFGTTLDLIRLPMDLAQGIVQNGDASGIANDLRNRVSAIAQPFVTLASNSDAFGNKIFGPATPADPPAKQWGAFIGSLPFVPSNISSITGLANPGESTAQSVSQAAGIPLRFNSATPSSVTQLANMIYTERTQLETQIKKEYLSGNQQDALTQMEQYNKALLDATIKSYEDSGHQVTDVQAFTQWLVSTNHAEGGIKDLVIKPPSQKVLDTAQQKQGQPLFNKIFPSNITSSTTQ
jgi:hypothetical protein